MVRYVKTAALTTKEVLWKQFRKVIKRPVDLYSQPLEARIAP